MKHRTVALWIIFVLVSVSFGFAGGGQAAQPGSSRVVVNTMAYGDNSNAEGQSWVRIVETFERLNPDVRIQYELLYDEAYHQKVSARLAAGDVPHLAYMGADARWGAPWAEASQQFDHRGIIDASYFDLDLIPPMGPNGEIWQIPLGTSNITTVLYMNERLVRSLGFSAPQTYEDLVAMVPAARAAGLTVVSINGADGWTWGSCLMSTFIARLSGDPNWVSKAVAGQNSFTDQVFVDSLNLITRMVNDGVIDRNSVLVDYGTNIANFSNEQALFMVQGQWAAGGIDPTVADNTVMLAWPRLPGERPATAGTVAAAIQVGYGVTKAGAADPAVRDAAMRFLRFYYSHEETTQRLIDGAIVAPILRNFRVPAELPAIGRSKVALAQRAGVTDVIDAFLGGAANDALNAGMQQIASGRATGAQVAAEVERLIQRR
jgi:raffinose/stachyose/melibiose transport system substrate-binding protein